ncbi:NAD-glutamate dehydrogenase [Wenzhouxiangella limi]|uniref:NAD-glutamate dehydrogenase n=1 Tax=Wenzhouxiangella limi TaxID=2707351 RepID=A0A845UZD0_9GAMM|nr:NAD-glutamate dehydrogenase [Wenzhouxiangella limi]NDY95270.1 NAD-glutamate dehydrogenase [Wenzhouxiangella limi]
MSASEEAVKRERLDAVGREIIERGGSEADAGFAHAFLQRVPPAELAEAGVEELAAMARGMREFARQRLPGAARVRVYNPERERDGWQSPHTVVEIINDDMPFLVDSVVLALTRLGISAQLIIHPVLRIRRDQGGHWLEMCPAETDINGESMMHVQIDRQSYPETLSEIEQSIGDGLADVRRAVTDWPAMCERARAIARDFGGKDDRIGQLTCREAHDFFIWLADDHFTFLGYREYRIEERDGERVLRALPETGLGIMHPDHRSAPTRSLRELSRGAERQTADNPIIITKTNAKSTVHRGGYMDYISVLDFNEAGEVTGEKRIIGLFTSGAYIRRCQDTPLVRRKVEEVMQASGLRSNSHAGKALVHILESLPRDELFQASADELLELGTGILDLQERSQTRLFIRRERFGRFFSCLVFIPRDRFNTENREKIQAILKRSLKGERLDFTVQVGESKLARVNVIVRPRADGPVEFDLQAIEQRIKQAIRSWSDELAEILVREHGEDQGLELSRRFGEAFPASYTEEVSPHVASYDVAHAASLRNLDDLRMSLYRPRQRGDNGNRSDNSLRFKLFKHGQPIPLSEVLPMLENLGLRIVSERPYQLKLATGHPLWIQDFDMHPAGSQEINLAAVRDNFQAAFEQIWRGRCENDGFNRLILLAQLDWRQASLLRALAKYLLQTGMPFSQAYMEQTLASSPLVARLLVEYFERRLDPARHHEGKAQRATARRTLETHCKKLADGYDDAVLGEYLEEVCCTRDAAPDKEGAKLVRKTILRVLDSVASADQDRILRAFCDLVRAILRTGYFQQDRRGEPRDYVAFKLDSTRVPDLPRPRPDREVWVYSPRTEGIHLRGGSVARGGLRWSDRLADFRTEVLGLMRAQSVKNTMIVPVGAKGGFVVKQPPPGDDRDALMAEVVHCYRSFINGLLDITDNLDGEDVKPPRDVVRHDGDDPYLVVAADKGTATFSDIANAISAEHGFWLGDAFASGGSNGYDHKAMGITARGAWESVKRHFRELGTDIQRQPFTVVGIGDMAGDVFGNGMLLSRQICLKAAFNHMHIFLDPDPDPDASFGERERLFKLPRSTWADYDEALISEGGGVYSRQAKSIPLSQPVRDWLGVETESMAPHELIRALLASPVDLLWNGGIGTYVKAAGESHADVGDLANNLVRVDGRDLRCRVVGEGGNLGLTQRGRIEYALAGGRLNTDFIDNSAGVDCSDHEVNIKILLDQAVKEDRLAPAERNELLAEMTDEVASLVLRSNYLQTQAISMMESLTSNRLGAEAHLIAMLDRKGVLDRDLEDLPDEEQLRERVARGVGLTRPELALLMSYSKITLYQDVLDSDVPEDPYLSRELEDYFPAPLTERFADMMPGHRLWREIIATRVTNSIVNRMGAHFATRIREDTGADSATMAKAYTVAREVFRARDYWARIEALDNQVPAAQQTEAVLEMWNLLRQATRRLIALPGGRAIDISSKVDRFAPGLAEYEAQLPDLLDEELCAQLAERRQGLVEDGFPEDLASRVTAIRYLQPSLDIVDEAASQDLPVGRVAAIYFGLIDRLCLKWLRSQIEQLPVERQWHAHARGNLRDTLYGYHRQLTRRILAEKGEEADPVAAWFGDYQAETARVAVMLEEMRNTSAGDYPSLQVALNGIDQLLKATAQ